MAEEKKTPLTLERFMEEMYGAKVETREWTPEYQAAVKRKLEEYGRRRREQALSTGPEATSSKSL